MQLSELIIIATNRLTLAGISSAVLDAQVLLGFTLSKDRSWIVAHPDHTLTDSDKLTFDTLIARRISNEPVAYITGKKEFYGRDFTVNEQVLVPRPESESFIELLHELKNNNKNTTQQKQSGISNTDPATYVEGFLHSVLDIGTGSGILAVTAKLEFPDLFVTATDISTSALTIAINNARQLGATITFKIQSLLASDKEGYDVILANLPYVPDTMRDKSIMHEPEMALFSGNDGLEHYRKLFNQLQPKHIRYVMTESLLVQHKPVLDMAGTAGYSLVSTNGLVQLYQKNKT